MKFKKFGTFSIVSCMIFSSCTLFGKKEDWATGPWAEHAKTAWNIYKQNLKNMGIELRSPSKLKTGFMDADGTLGKGDDRFPFKLMDGVQVGGYLEGYCNGPATTYMARESSGYWNVNAATHEVGHHANNHAKCSQDNNGHPSYMKQAGAPHWPYWTGRRELGSDITISYFHYESEGRKVCFFYFPEVDSSPIKVLSLEHQERLIGIAKKLLNE